jgi:hypothetical protein
LVLSRDLTDGELATLRGLFAAALTAPPASKNKSAASPKGGSGKELAALTAVASVLFNLDAALTR